MPAYVTSIKDAPMSTLEHHRKQAKLYLKWHRDRHYPVAEMIRALLPRFRDLTDREILDGMFKLADAQELVARKSGSESWQALTKGLPTTTGPTTKAEKPELTLAEPQLFTGDMEASLDFYTRRLGFRVRFTYGSPPFYAGIGRDGARLNVRHLDRSPFTDGIRKREELLSATIILDTIKPLFLEYQAAGVEFHQKLRLEPWGARTFIIVDPDGNLICFSADE